MHTKRWRLSAIGTAILLLLNALSSCVILLPCAASTGDQIRRGFMLAPGADTSYLNGQVRDLYSMGARIVRYPIYFEVEPSPNVWISRINSLLDACDRDCADMMVVVDIHHPSTVPCSPMSAACNDIPNNDAFVRLWKRLASAFRNRAAMRVSYDILNEPRSSYNGEAWSNLALRVARQIRAVDSLHPIVYAVPGDRTTQITRQVPTFTPLPGIANQVCEVHFWNWVGTDTNPDVQTVTETGVNHPYGVSPRSKVELQAVFDAMAAWRSKWNVPIYIGEVGINEANSGAAAFLKDFTDLANKYHMNTTIHAYEEYSGWSYELNPQAWHVLLHWLDPNAQESINATDTYAIISVWTGKCLDLDCWGGSANGTKIQEWDYLAGPNQKWHLQAMGNGYYEIVSAWTGKCIDLDCAGGPVNGARIQEWDYLAGPNQKWYLQPLGDDTYEIISKWTGKCLDLDCWGGSTNGTKIQEWDYLAGPNQRWRIVRQ